MDVDGKPSARMTVSEIRQMFKKEGKHYVLGIRTGVEIRRIKLKTRKLI
jgi:hypothetical protein